MKIEKWNSEQMTCEVFALSTIVPYLQFSKEQIKILCKILGTHDWLLNIFYCLPLLYPNYSFKEALVFLSSIETKHLLIFYILPFIPFIFYKRKSEIH